MMTLIDQELAEIRNRICDWMVIAISITSIPVVAIELLRIPEIGWHWVMGLEIVGLLILGAFVVLHNFISYQIRGTLVICLFLIIGTSGTMRNGMIAGATPFLILAPILGTFLFSTTTGVILAVISLLSYASVGILIVTGQIVHTINVNQQIVSPAAWANHAVVYLMTIAVVIAATIMMRRQLVQALGRSLDSAAQLMDLNHNLEKMVADRTEELQQARDASNRLAHTDELTNLYNRRAFFEQGNKIHSLSVRHQRTYAVAMIDIDHFKSINDRWGHKMGDEVLKAVAAVLASALRTPDLIARIGGEEFAVVMPETSLAEAREVVERLRTKLEITAIKSVEDTLYISASIGLSALKADSKDLETVLSQSDAAMYKAKTDGRNCVRSYDDINVKSD